jgi:hypothetical protein
MQEPVKDQIPENSVTGIFICRIVEERMRPAQTE